MAEREKKYNYVNLKDCVSAVGYDVNVWGIVSRLEPPRATRGTDLLMSIWLVDPSMDQGTPADQQGLEVRFWAAEKMYVTGTPSTAKIGDIIRIHRAGVKEYDGRRFLEVKVANYKVGAAFVVWHGGVGDTEEPIAISSRTYTFTDTDRLTIRSLRQFNVERAAALGAPVGMPIPAVGQALLAADRAREEQYMRRVHTLDHGEAPFADLLCQVIGLDRRSGALVMYVWDGTDAKPYPETLTTAANGPALQRYEMPLYQHELGAIIDPRNVPGMGTLVPVVDPDGRIPDPDSLLGRWIRLRNVAVTVVQGQTQLLFHARSGWRAEPGDDRSVRDLLSTYYTVLKPRRILAGYACSNPDFWAARTTFAPGEIRGVWPEPADFPHPHRPEHPQLYNFPLSTLREVRAQCLGNDELAEDSRETRLSFASLVRIARVRLPSGARDLAAALVRPARPMAALQMDRAPAEAAAVLEHLPEHIYNIELVLEDSTSALPVRLCSPHADELLGVPADVVARSPAAAQRVLDLLLMAQSGFPPALLTRPEAAGVWLGPEKVGGPWLEVGLRAVKMARVDCVTRLPVPQWTILLVRTQFNQQELRIDRLLEGVHVHVDGGGGAGGGGTAAEMA